MGNSENQRRDSNKPAGTHSIGDVKTNCGSKKSDKNPKVTKKTNSVKITCSHGRVCPTDATFFELVPTAGTTMPYTDRTTVVWTGPNIPASLSATIIGEIKGGGTYFFPFNFERTSELATSVGNIKNSAQKGIGDVLDLNFAGAIGHVAEVGALTLFELAKEMWTYNHCKNYVLSSLPMGSLPIKVYNPEKWTITVKFPKLKSFKSGLSLEKELKTDKMVLSAKSSNSSQDGNSASANLGNNTYTKTESKSTIGYKPGEITVESKDSLSTSGMKLATSSDTKVNIVKNETNVNSVKVSTLSSSPNMPSSTGDYISVSRNGSPLKLDVLNSISTLLKLVDTIYSIVELIKETKDLVPSAGISFDFNVQVMDGNFQIEWAWKEYTDHRAYYNIKPSINVKLLSGSLEIAFGVKCKLFKAQAYISGGLDIPLIMQFENIKPGETWYGELQSKGKIAIVLSLTVGAKVQVGYFLNINPLITAGISLNGGVTGISGFGLEVSYGFTGLTAKIEYSIGPGGGYAVSKSYEKSGQDKNYQLGNTSSGIYADGNSDPTTKVLIQAFDWGVWKFPDKTDPKQDIDEQGFATIIEDMLTGKTNRNGLIEFVRIKSQSERKWWTSNLEDLSLSQLSLRIAQKANRKPLMRNAKSLQAIANEIRDALLVINYKGFWNDNYVTLEELGTFIDGGALEEIYSKCEVPTKLI